MGLPVPVTSSSPVSGCDDVQLGLQITLLNAQINVANSRLLNMIAEFDLRGGWRCGDAVRSCAHWLAAHCGMTIGAARERVRVARALAGLPEVEQAFATGDLSYSKVRAITRVATEGNQSLLLAMAEKESASHLEKLVGRYQPVDELGLEAVARPLQEERQDDWKDTQKARLQAVAQHIARRHQEAGVTVAGDGNGTALGIQLERAQEKISAETFSQFMNQVRADAFIGMAEHFFWLTR